MDKTSRKGYEQLCYTSELVSFVLFFVQGNSVISGAKALELIQSCLKRWDVVDNSQMCCNFQVHVTLQPAGKSLTCSMLATAHSLPALSYLPSHCVPRLLSLAVMAIVLVCSGIWMVAGSWPLTTTWTYWPSAYCNQWVLIHRQKIG